MTLQPLSSGADASAIAAMQGRIRCRRTASLMKESSPGVWGGRSIEAGTFRVPLGRLLPTANGMPMDEYFPAPCEQPQDQQPRGNIPCWEAQKQMMSGPTGRGNVDASPEDHYRAKRENCPHWLNDHAGRKITAREV